MSDFASRPATKARDVGSASVADVVISAGNKNFHLLFAAAEMARRGRLALLIAGALPTPIELRLLPRSPLARLRMVKRFLNRQERIPVALTRQNRLSELIMAFGLVLRRLVNLPGLEQSIQRGAFQFYGWRAAKMVQEAHRAGAKIYHVRAGYGQASIRRARALGMRVICDHSIVHPALLEPLIVRNGRFPENLPSAPRGIWELVLRDIETADEVLVNSDFVAQTFAFMKFDMGKVHVAYQGVEDKFLDRLASLPAREAPQADAPLRLLFAGGIGPRKGIDVLQQCLCAEPDLPVTLTIAGMLEPSTEASYGALLRDGRVTYRGMLPQAALAEAMRAADVFVFPSRAEGSARVVFEAMAAGCAIITTPNAGSVVTPDEGGYLIAPGDAAALGEALRRALAERDRVAAMGAHNAALIRARYTQKHYGDALERIYQ